jgi:hypothetical protein
VTFNENIDNYRLKEVEDELIDGCAKEKMEGKDPFIATSEDEVSFSHFFRLFLFRLIVTKSFLRC